MKTINGLQNATFKYQKVSIGIMNTQINLRLPEKLLNAAKVFSKKHGYSTTQEFIKETLREKLFETQELTKEEFNLVKKLIEVSEKKNLYGTEKELFKKLKRR